MRRTLISHPHYGYLRMDPLPSPQELEEYYRGRYYTGRTIFRDFSLEPVTDELEYFTWRCGDIIRAVNEHHGRTAGLSILDLGCGYGYSLEHFRAAGMDAFGIEPSAEAADYAASRGLNVVRAGIDSASNPFNRRFDVVLLMDVLEHLVDPAGVLRLVRKNLLTEDGLLVVDVPNDFNAFQTAANAEHGLNEWWVIPPEHINYFTVESISSLIAQTGFAVKAAESSFPLELFLLMGDRYVGDAELGRICHKKRVAFERAMRKHQPDALRAFYRSMAGLSLGRQVVVYAIPEK